MLAAQEVGRGDGETAEDDILGVDHEPLTLDVSRLRSIRTHGETISFVSDPVQGSGRRHLLTNTAPGQPAGRLPSRVRAAGDAASRVRRRGGAGQISARAILRDTGLSRCDLADYGGKRD
ncbi:hypothetical protein GCM10028772_39620 [Nocardioides ultimimeridianus]